jgi:hypothetical protein
LIKYTDASGREAIIEAPWGSLLEYLAKNEHFGLVNEGKGFIDPATGEQVPNNERPDVVHPAVKRIQDLRAEQYARKHPDGAEADQEPQLSGGITRAADRLRRLIPTRAS